MHRTEVGTPALVVATTALDHNLATMAAVRPGPRLRPHVKAHKCSALARRQAAAGHTGFTCATIREVEVLAAAGLGDDVLLANEVVDARRLGELIRRDVARVTLAVDSDATVDAAAAAGIREVLVDVDVGMPRCGCEPQDAPRLAERARAAGLVVRGVMGYEGHAVGMADRAERVATTTASMEILRAAHDEVGGEVVSAGGTGTYDINDAATEIQAGSYALMDTAYGRLDLPFRQALVVEATVISVSRKGWAVADCGLKALGMDHGKPSIAGAAVWYVADEHVVFGPAEEGGSLPSVGNRVQVVPAHVDPTVAYHERIHVVGDEGEVLDTWPVDMRGW